MLALACVLAAPAHAGEGARNVQWLDLRYGMTYHGLPVASASFAMRPDGGVARSELVIKEEGVAALFGGSTTRMTATTRLAPHPQPERFEAIAEKSDRTRQAIVEWDGAGAIASAVEVKRGRQQPSEVPADQQRGTVDPLTAVIALQDWLMEPSTRPDSTTSLAVFDGRKRYDLAARRLPDQIDQGRRWPRLAVRLVPVYGFDEKDQFVSWPDAPPRWFEVILSDDGRLAPLQIGEAGAPFVVATHDCATSGECVPVTRP